jgi:hypothetical protein
MNTNRRSWRKGEKKNVKVRFVNNPEDSDSPTYILEDSKSDDSVEFEDSSDENKMNANRRTWRKGKKKNVKVRFVDSPEDSDSQTNTPDDSNSDDSVQFEDSSDDSESHGTTLAGSTDEEDIALQSEDTETLYYGSDNNSDAEEDTDDESKRTLPQEERKIITKPMIAKTKKLRGRRKLIYEKLGVRYPEIEWTNNRVRKLQLKDNACRDFIDYMENEILPEDDVKARKILLTAHFYIIDEGVLYRLPRARSKKNLQNEHRLRVCLVVPELLKSEILAACHGDVSSCHFGIDRTFARLKDKYFWTTMFKDLVGMDLVGMHRSDEGYTWILTFTEYCTRYVCAYPLKEADAQSIARIFLDRICFVHGFPEVVLSDKGQNLAGWIFIG